MPAKQRQVRRCSRMSGTGPSGRRRRGRRCTTRLSSLTRSGKDVDPAGTSRPRRGAVFAEGRFGREANMTTFLIRSEEHTSELQSLMRTSYAVFCLKKKKRTDTKKYKTK